MTGPVFAPRQQILGHEFSGTVVEVSSELRDYRQGDRAAIQPILPPGARKLPVEKVISSRVNLDAAVPNGFEPLSTPGTDRLKILVQPAT